MPTTNRYYDTFNTAARLPARVLRNFSLAVAVAGTLATLAALVPSPFANAAIVATPILEHTVTLPIVVVRPEPITLATVTVRGSDALHDGREENPSMLARVHATGLRAVGTLAHRGASGSGSGMAMPYYSFAKPMRVSNEE